ncbi:MAG: SHOCT domain-containing protein [Saprospiraceae bacterium]|nr:SHOCT domain-containing protein [Saprospiraceae bacterium]
MINFKNLYNWYQKYEKTILLLYLIWCVLSVYLVISDFSLHSIGLIYKFKSNNNTLNSFYLIAPPGLFILILKFILPWKKLEFIINHFDRNLDFNEIKAKLVEILLSKNVPKILFIWTIVNIFIYFKMANNGISAELKQDYFVSIYSPSCCPDDCTDNYGLPNVCQFKTLLQYYDLNELIFYVLIFWLIYLLSLYVFKGNYAENSLKLKLIKLNDLFESNLISEEEYNIEKQKILSQL